MSECGCASVLHLLQSTLSLRIFSVHPLNKIAYFHSLNVRRVFAFGQRCVPPIRVEGPQAILRYLFKQRSRVHLTPFSYLCSNKCVWWTNVFTAIQKRGHVQSCSFHNQALRQGNYRLVPTQSICSISHL